MASVVTELVEAKAWATYVRTERYLYNRASLEDVADAEIASLKASVAYYTWLNDTKMVRFYEEALEQAEDEDREVAALLETIIPVVEEAQAQKARATFRLVK
jgi:hypothetical protein